MEKCKGLTLVELMAVIGIVGILCGLAFPSFTSLLQRAKGDRAAHLLYHPLNHARTVSITKNITTTACASINDKQCLRSTDWSYHDIIIFHDKNSNGNIDTGEPLLSKINLGLEENSLKWRSFGNRNYLQWQPSGMTYYQNGNFTYCPKDGDTRFAKRIILNAAGRIYFGYDRNKDGIQEGTDGKNITC